MVEPGCGQVTDNGKEEMRIANVALTRSEWVYIEQVALREGLTFSQAVRQQIALGRQVNGHIANAEERRQRLPRWMKFLADVFCGHPGVTLRLHRPNA
jgi:hypothetical protein